MFSVNSTPLGIPQHSLGPSLATLSIEVSYPFHSHLIGRSGQNINRTMKETGTRIHFPDRNRISNEVKSNSVMIRGEPANLENARQRIRADIPVEFIVDCSFERINVVGQSSLLQYFSTTFGVVLRFYPKVDGVNCQVNIRGHQNGIKELKDSVTYFRRLMHNNLDTVVMKVETSFDHVWLIRDHINKIVAATGAGIRCPDVSVLKDLPKKYCVWIRGSFDQVYLASSMLHGLLPMQLIVQVPPNRVGCSFLVEAKDVDVFARLERSVDTLTIRLTSYEWNARNLFDLLQRCLDQPSIQAVMPNLPSNWLGIADITRNTFISASQKLSNFLSSNDSSCAQQFSAMVIDMPQSSGLSDQTSSSTSLPSPINETYNQPSLAASRFDLDSSRHLSQLLETVGLFHYSDLFKQNEVDLAMFTTLKDDDLITIGIVSFGARKILLNVIQELRR
ncbi:protein bicaudal C homolog 1-B-like [Daphnia carinata]|uniref:protein bicaudal C homolog 1-B-like n=1 Tax=Daphnia carinata TaxID=120202 RepID=UPI00257DD18A|nr:protein bicaudal C homolog 1-B-like [Daphnia carinata]